MNLRKTWQRTALWLGIGWSLLWSVVLADLPLIQQLDLIQHDRLIRLSHPHTPPPEIVLLPIANADLKTWGTDKEAQIYTNLVNRLLTAEAAVVVLNLLPNWVQTSDHDHHPLKDLIQQHPTQLVIVLPTSTAAKSNPSEWRNYEYILPPNPDRNRLLNPESLLGFVEYAPEAKHPTSIHSTARQAHLSGQFTLTCHLDRSPTLYSAALLTLQKFRTQTNPRQSLPPLPSQTPIQIQFWGPTGTFPTLSAPAVLANSSDFSQVRDKIVP